MEFITENITENECDGVAIVADENLTRELLYLAVNNKYEIGMVELHTKDCYDMGYITTISWCGDNFEITIETAYGSSAFLASDFPTFVQDNWEYKCEYINDVKHNKYLDPDLELFMIGDYEDYTLYSYANEYNNGNSKATVFVESNIKDFVDIVRDTFEDIFD